MTKIKVFRMACCVHTSAAAMKNRAVLRAAALQAAAIPASGTVFGQTAAFGKACVKFIIAILLIYWFAGAAIRF